MIQIFSRNEAINFITEFPDYPIIIIGETFDNDYLRLSSIANNKLVLRFEDIHHPIDGWFPIHENQVAKALEWSKDKKDLAVACKMGISRSSSLAFVIEATRTSPEEATKVFTNRSRPNSLVIEKGEQVTGINLQTAITKYRMDQPSNSSSSLHQDRKGRHY